jgi:predicted nucleic acid-binding protein
MFLLDTVAVSELIKRRQNQGFSAWFSAADTGDLFVSVITFGELELGIELQRPRLPDFARRLEVWRDGILRTYGERILPVTIDIATLWGRLAESIGHLDADGGIAATAIVHDLAVVTRNARHFEGTGARVVNPFGP